MNLAARSGGVFPRMLIFTLSIKSPAPARRSASATRRGPVMEQVAVLGCKGLYQTSCYFLTAIPTDRWRTLNQEFSSANSGFYPNSCLPFQLMIDGETPRLENNVLSPGDEATLGDALKRCSPRTLEAARAFRKTGNVAHVPAVVLGVIERFVERDLRRKFQHPDATELRLIGDLNVDSLTMLEAVLLLEEVLQITIDNEELQTLRTLGDIQQFMECKLRALTRSKSGPTSPIILSRSLEQRALSDHPRRLPERIDLTKNTKIRTVE